MSLIILCLISNHSLFFPLITTLSGRAGFKWDGWLGTVVHSLRPINICARQNPFCRGVNLNAKARYGSSALVIRFFIVWTAHQLPHYSADILATCWNSYFLVSVANDWNANCGPLSVKMTSGIPCLANIDFKCAVTSAAFVSVSLAIRMNLE